MTKTMAQQLNDQIHNLDLGTGIPNGNQQEVSEMSMNEHEIIGAIQPVQVNPAPNVNNTPMMMEVNTKEDTKVTTTKTTPKDTTNQSTNNTTKKETTKVNNNQTKPKATRWAWQDDMAKVGELEDANKARELIQMHVSGTTGNMCREIASMKSNADRDLFCIWAAKMYGYDFGNTNRSRIYYRLIKNNDSLYNKIIADTASELPTMQKIENGIIAGTTLFGKVLGAVIGSGVAAFGGAIAVGTKSAILSSIEIEKAYLESKCMKNLNPELQALRELNAQIKAAKSMAADAQDKPKDVDNGTSKA